MRVETPAKISSGFSCAPFLFSFGLRIEIGRDYIPNQDKGRPSVTSWNHLPSYDVGSGVGDFEFYDVTSLSASLVGAVDVKCVAFDQAVIASQVDLGIPRGGGPTKNFCHFARQFHFRWIASSALNFFALRTGRIKNGVFFRFLHVLLFFFRAFRFPLPFQSLLELLELFENQLLVRLELVEPIPSLFPAI